MKKLLTAILAFSCAFGAWAEEVSRLSGTDFSTYPVGVFSTETDDSGITESAQRYWFTGNKEDFDGEVVNVSSNEDASVVENYLEFESNITNPVYRTVNDSFGAVAPDATLGDNANQGFVAKKIGTGIFIDTKVQFTPYLVNENHPSPTKLTDKDKIIVWVKETESLSEDVANTTNLVVTAGYIEADGSATATNYVIDCDADALCKGRYRLTIKAFADISANSTLEIAGFVVYIDGEKVSYLDNEQEAFAIDVSLDTTPGIYYTNEKKSLFPSLMGNTAGGVDGGDEISAVGFAGMGQVREVWFDDYSTAYPAFASDDINFEIGVGDGVTSYTYNGETYTETKTFAVKPGTASIEVTGVTYDTAKGWVAKAGTWFAGTTQVNNVGADNGDSGTFSFANGSQFTLAGFKANFEVTDAKGVTTAFQTLFGNTAESGALASAYGGTLKLTSDITIDEGDGSILIGQGQTLILDLNGHTIQGTSETDATIRNNGTLTINDSSVAQTGKVLGLAGSLENTAEPFAIKAYEGSITTINAGEYDSIDRTVDDSGDLNNELIINGGKFLDFYMVNEEDTFYLSQNDPDVIAAGKAIIDMEAREIMASEVLTTFYWVVVGENVDLVTVTLPAASANSSWKVLVGETEYTVANNQVAVPAGSELTLYLVAATGYEFEGGASEVEVEHNQGAVTADADWSTTLGTLPVPTLKVVVDPWELEEETDVSATNKVAEIFGEDSPAATNITSYVAYTNLVEYIKTVKGETVKDTDLSEAEMTYIIESLKLGAAELFTAEPKIKLTEAQPSTDPNAEAGDWVFEVKVTQGSAVDALKVAVDKVKALVKIRSDLKTGQWAAPEAANIDAAEVTDGNEITIKIKFGDAKSGFMMIRERE